MQILVIDDEPMIGEMLAKALGDIGQATHFLSAEDALKDFQPGKYDIALIDLHMPEIPGDVLAERLKQADPDLPRICITGFILDDVHPKAAIFDAIIKKPFGLGLLDVIKRFARERED